jgi:hypothetical protein
MGDGSTTRDRILPKKWLEIEIELTVEKDIGS